MEINVYIIDIFWYCFGSDWYLIHIKALVLLGTADGFLPMNEWTPEPIGYAYVFLL